MKVINRLDEIAKINKYSKYISNKLVPEFNKETGLELISTWSTDPYTMKYVTIRDESNEMMHITLQFTTNRREMDGKFWATFHIMGQKEEAGNMTGNLKTDTDILLDTYYYFFEKLEANGIRPVRIKLGD